jgi:pyruvate formate lyase activating enzyme
MKKIAQFWKKINDKKVQCTLCAHNCKIGEGKVGICKVRKNEKGVLYSLIYGMASSLASDPIEKKPLYHFHPGSYAFSVGTIGCNFKCKHCQNFSISTADTTFPYLKEVTPEQVLTHAKQYKCQGVSYTYNEPTIWHEFALDSAKVVKKAGLYTCYVTNGFINEEPLKELAIYLDAMNIDVKAFNDDFYKNICKSKLEPVLNTCMLAKELGIHLELTYLVIPGFNDSLEEIKKFCKWIVEGLDDKTPVHFSRFHPDYNMTNVQATPMETLLKIYEVAKETGVLYPFLGNVFHGEYENTYCPKCGSISIERDNYSINIDGLNKDTCRKCGNHLPIIINKNKK